MRLLPVGVLGMLALAASTAAAQETAQGLPEGVTAEMVSEGAELFKGPGVCSACHGPDGAGVPNVGANLQDGEWVHSDGSFEGILSTIMQGVAADKSSTGGVMPPKGGGALSDEQLEAVAAYVWSLRQR